jgi:hypothetical protein
LGICGLLEYSLIRYISRTRTTEAILIRPTATTRLHPALGASSIHIVLRGLGIRPKEEKLRSAGVSWKLRGEFLPSARHPSTDMFFGDRYCWVSDPWGHVWALATVKEILSEGEIQRRAEEFMTAMSKNK